MERVTTGSEMKRVLYLLCLGCAAMHMPLIAYADAPEPIQYLSRCDELHQQLTVAEMDFMPAPDTQVARTEITELSVYPEDLTEIAGTDEHPLRLPARREVFSCRLGTAMYTVEIKPHIFNTRVLGRCGAALPTISVSIRRNGEAVLSGVEFSSCRTQRAIRRIQINEALASIDVLAYMDLYSLPRVNRTFPLASFPDDWQWAIFEDLPTGDLDVDLFVAVSERDISAVQDLLQKGANPNAKNASGFPPLGVVIKGRSSARKQGMLDEFDRTSLKLAEMLFANGASGNATNVYGLTLLDYMIGSGPDAITYLMLANGADPLEGNPLRKAVDRGDVKLTQTLLDAGADPNKPGRDRRPPLFAASTAGLIANRTQTSAPAEEYAKCVRLLLQQGASVRDAYPGYRDEKGLFYFLVTQYGKDENLRPILTEMAPYTDRDELNRTHKRAQRIAYGSESYMALVQWLEDQAH